MSSFLRYVTFFVCLYFATVVPAVGAVSLSKSVAAYGRDMEFYYREKRQEVLPGILRVFDAQGVLSDAGKRLTTAAFLAEVLRHDFSVRNRIFAPAASLSRNGRRTLAWTAHLAEFHDEDALYNELLDQDDSILLRQIRQCPGSLAQWNMYEDHSVLQMYWAAFFAAGETFWVDRIINAALRYSRLNAAGLTHAPQFSAGEAAAASLFDTMPRHALVRERLEFFLKYLMNDGAGFSSPEVEMLRLILRMKQ